MIKKFFKKLITTRVVQDNNKRASKYLRDWGKISHICKLNSKGLNLLSNIDSTTDEDKYFDKDYPYKEARKVFFVTSSGNCNLTCSYCITNRPKGMQSLKVEDFSYIFDHFGEDIYFAFSGIGDFFAGYGNREYLLEYLLRHRVKIYLDINGADIKELAHKDLAGKEKIDMINISYHYESMKRQRLLKNWRANVFAIHRSGINYDIKIISTPKEVDLLKDAIEFYALEIKPVTGQRLLVVPDGLLDLASQMSKLQEMEDQFSDVITLWRHKAVYDGIVSENKSYSPCAAGSRYFRLINNGDLFACELAMGNGISNLGNVKRKEVITLARDVSCSFSRLCDCSWASNPRTGLMDEDGQPYLWRKAAQ